MNHLKKRFKDYKEEGGNADHYSARCRTFPTTNNFSIAVSTFHKGISHIFSTVSPKILSTNYLHQVSSAAFVKLHLHPTISPYDD